MNISGVSKDLETLVIDEMHGRADPEKVKWLHTEGVDEWVRALTALVIDLESQFAASKSRLEKALRDGSADDPTVVAAAEEEMVRLNEWRRRASRFKANVVAKLAYARSLQKSQRETAATRFDRLRAAVQEHREAVEPLGSPTPADRRLWALLDEL